MVVLMVFQELYVKVNIRFIILLHYFYDVCLLFKICDFSFPVVDKIIILCLIIFLIFIGFWFTCLHMYSENSTINSLTICILHTIHEFLDSISVKQTYALCVSPACLQMHMTFVPLYVLTKNLTVLLQRIER
jgi:hypothetical protein